MNLKVRATRTVCAGLDDPRAVIRQPISPSLLPSISLTPSRFSLLPLPCIQMGNFALRVRRSTAGAAAAPAALAPAAYAAPPPAVSKPAPAESTSAEEAAGVDVSIDESVITVTAPKVGVFRRGNYAGGKRVGKGNAADEKTSVKKGQPLGYVEQLGTFVKVEAPQAGEIVRFLVPDGGSVEYKQGIVEMAPFFGTCIHAVYCIADKITPLLRRCMHGCTHRALTMGCA